MIPLQKLFSNRILTKIEQYSSIVGSTNNSTTTNQEKDRRIKEYLTRSSRNEISNNNLINFLNSANRSNSYKQNIQYSDIQNNFIYNIEDVENQNKASFLYSVENNNFFESITTDLLNDIVGYKRVLINKKFEKLENKFNMFSNVKSNAENLHSIFTSKFTNNNLIIKEIKDGITEKVNKVKSNSFESLLKNDVFNESRSSYFFQITDYFLRNKNVTPSNIDPTREDVNLKQISKKIKIKNIDNSILRSSLIEIYNPDTDEFIKEIKTTSNDIIVQNFINLSRSFYTLSPNSLKGNIKNEITTRFIDFELESLKCYQSEIEGFNIFSYIDENNHSCSISFPGNVSSLKNQFYKNFSSDLNDINTIYADGQTIQFFNDVNSSLGKDSFYYKDYFTGGENNLNFLFNKNYILSNNVDEIINNDLALKFKDYLDNLNKLLTGEFYNLSTFNLSFNNTEFLKNDLFSYYEYYISNDELFSSPNTIDIHKQQAISIYLIINNILSSQKENYNSVYYKNNHIYNYKTDINSDYNLSFFLAQKLNPYDFNYRIFKAISTNKNFDTDYHINIDDFNYKLKLDSFIKKAKISNLKNKNIDFLFLNQIVTNIKNMEDNSKVLLPYCIEDTDNVCCLGKEDEIFNFLFEVDDEENIAYSYTDIVSDYEINGKRFLGLEDLKKSRLEINNNKINNFVNKFTKVLSNYYPKNNFFSSSTFFRNILNSIVLEAENTELLQLHYFDYSLIQSLYFNYYKIDDLENTSNNLETKNVIAKRFLKKSIMLDNNSSQNFSVSRLSDYKYKIEEIDTSDFDLTTEQGNDDYLDEIINSSENLKIIRQNIFSIENFESLNKQTDFKNFNNFNLKTRIDSPYTGTTEGNYLCFDEFGISLPYVISRNKLVYDFNNPSNFNNLKNKIKVRYKNIFNILSERNSEGVNVPTGEVRGYEENAFFDITKSYNIKTLLKIYPNNITEFRNTSNWFFSDNDYGLCVIIEDLFDEACNQENMVFNSICKSIQELLRIKIANYKNLIFNSESDIDNFIENNVDVFDDINTIIDLYKDFYFVYLNRVNSEYAIKSFDLVEKTTSQSKYIQNKQIAKFDDNLSKSWFFSNQVNSFKLYEKEIHENSIKDIKRIIARIDSNQIRQNLSSTPEEWNTVITDKINNIYNSFYDSDLKQSFYFDLIHAYIIHQQENIGKSLEDLSSSDSFDNLRSILKEDIVNKIESNFYNLFFINKLSKNIFIDELLYKQYESNININTSSGSLDYYKNSNDDVLFFDADRVIEESFLNRNNFSFGEDILDKEIFGKTLQEYFDSSFYNFGIDDNFLKNCNPYSIIKVTAIAVDQFNLNRLYIPKTYLFSPLLTDISFVSMSNIDSIGNQVSSNHIGFYDINKNVNERLMSFNINDTDEINDIKTYFKNIIKNKFKNIKDDIESDASDFDLNNLVDYLFKCHLMSSKSKNLSKVLYDTDTFDNKNRKIIDKKIVELTDELSEKEFYNIFDHKRDKVRNKLTEFIDNFELPSAYDSIKDKSCFYMLNDYLSNVGSFNSIEKLEGEDYYDTYCIPININNFKYINIEDNQFSSVNSFDYAGNENLISIHKIISDFDIDFLLKDDIYIKNHKNKNTSFNIFFKVQVLN